MALSRVVTIQFFLRLAAWGESCPGSFVMEGYGEVAAPNALWNVPGMLAGPVAVTEGIVAPSMFGRTYFADVCNQTGYNHHRYAAVKLLDKTMRYTTDVSGAGCGCNAALYLTSLHQCTDVSQCEDFYCDANRVCGVSCAEIDLEEANERAWHSTLHVQDDGSGIGLGYGGGDGWNGHRDWDSSQYGPGSTCIDTTKPFQVAVSFPADHNGVLRAMEVELSQVGTSCSITRTVGGYAFSGRNAMAELTTALANGMTPIISYWKADNMLWLDGPGTDGQGPCHKDSNYGVCSATTVKFYDFSIGQYQGRRLDADMVV